MTGFPRCTFAPTRAGAAQAIRQYRRNRDTDTVMVAVQAVVAARKERRLTRPQTLRLLRRVRRER